MTDHLEFVQFPHPGREHRPDRSGYRGWTLKVHGRKYMASHGTWLDELDPDALRHRGEIEFWGEWEGPSRVVAELEQSEPGSPRFLYEPLWDYPPDHPEAQNTDPFVFGDRFLYSNCRQNTKHGPMKTQRLAVGSIIAFGSGGFHDFVLDTLFVVARARPITWESIDELEVDPVFRALTLELLGPGPEGPSFTLYEGATPNEPVGGMFSFFPCSQSDGGRSRFARPAVELSEKINPTNWRAAKLTPIEDLEAAHDIWADLAKQVLASDLSLGTHAEMPDAVPVLGPRPRRRRGNRNECTPAPASC